ncbi:MAG: mechanosensitive ion channel [Verrucomicrobia subdivision 3 bacterium]|nr:mechanosensitive ion channel [Limisphaerales bacterium]
MIALIFTWLTTIVASGAAQNPVTRTLLPEARAPAESTNAAAGPRESIEEKLAQVRADLAAVKALTDAAGTNRPPGSSFEAFGLRRSLLQRLERLYEQQISFATELQALKNRRLEIAREAETWTTFSELRPYSILLTDSLRESIQVERLEIAHGESALSKLAQLVQEQRTLLKQAEAKIRQLNEQLEGGADSGELTRQRELERLRSQTAAATVAVLDLERQVREERVAASRVRLTLLGRQLVIANAGATFSDAEMEKVLARLDKEQRQLESELADAEARHRAAVQARDAASAELARTQSQADASPAALARAGELIELRRTQLETADTVLAVLRFMLQASTIERTIWEARFASYRSRSAETIRQTASRLDQFRRRIDLWKTYYQQQLESASSHVALQEERLAGLDPLSTVVPLVRERLASLRERDQMLLRVVRGIERGDRLLQRLEEELRDAAESLPLASRVRNVFADSRSLLARLWNFELFVAQDTITVQGQPITGKRSVTLGKILTAILILVVGYWLTGLLSRLIEPIIVKRFKIDANQADLIRRWFRVVLIFSLALFSLISVKIPLTIFAFAGGALAIGLGFGMQTMLKNFVSGIIILFERPFRVGDVLDVAGQRGTIVGIGIRSSVLRQWDSTETLIPNSTLLENSVTNWTYSNRKVRFTVAVGVAYGSDTRRVVQLLAEIADRHGLVEKEPKPQVLFTDFGDSALTFELRFWVNVVAANSAQVASDLRQMIAGAFAENGIVMAFPQRDIHLDAVRPLQVQVVPVSSSPVQENGALPKPELTNSPDGAPDSAPSKSEPTPTPRLP